MRNLMISFVFILTACAPALKYVPRQDITARVDGTVAAVRKMDCGKYTKDSVEWLACQVQNDNLVIRAELDAAKKQLAARSVAAPAAGPMLTVFDGYAPIDTGWGLVVTSDRPDGVDQGFALYDLDRNHDGISTVRCFRRNGANVPVSSRYPNPSIVSVMADMDRSGTADPTPYLCTTAPTVWVPGMEVGDSVEVISLRASTSRRLAGGVPFFTPVVRKRFTFERHHVVMGGFYEMNAQSGPPLS